MECWVRGSSWLLRPIDVPALLNEGFRMEGSTALTSSERSKNPLLDLHKREPSPLSESRLKFWYYVVNQY
jgi:hypothetical protein